MKKYILTFVLFIVFIMILAIMIGKNDDDTVAVSDELSENVELVEKPTARSESNETPIQSKEVISDEDSSLSEIQSENPLNLKGHPEQIIQRVAYIVSYNSSTKCPNWVSWNLTKEHTDGPFPRKGVPYYEDDGTAVGIGVVTNDNFSKGYFLDMDVKGVRQEFTDWNDRRYNVNHGHLCPAGDNKWSKAAMNQSFYLTNMCPQDIDLNGGDWEGLERRCRGWANRFGGINIIAGPIFSSKGYRTMGEGKVGIPDAFFKVVLRNGKDVKGIGFIFPNEGTHHDLSHYVKTIDEVEDITGFDFFSQLPDEIETTVESSSDLKEW